jgi:hypothetical protein
MFVDQMIEVFSKTGGGPFDQFSRPNALAPPQTPLGRQLADIGLGPSTCKSMTPSGGPLNGWEPWQLPCIHDAMRGTCCRHERHVQAADGASKVC